ncbi:unnamed protein product, partial [Brassica rapa]
MNYNFILRYFKYLTKNILEISQAASSSHSLSVSSFPSAASSSSSSTPPPSQPRLRLHRFFLRQNPLVANKVNTVLTAIFQGSVSVLIFTNTSNFLGSLMSYVRDEDSAAILKLGAYVDSGDCRGGVAMKKSGKVQNDENLRIVHWPMAVPSLKLVS